jgi:hypothetical protein
MTDSLHIPDAFARRLPSGAVDVFEDREATRLLKTFRAYQSDKPAFSQRYITLHPSENICRRLRWLTT